MHGMEILYACGIELAAKGAWLVGVEYNLI